MSITGSLVGYENNNQIECANNKKKQRRSSLVQQKQQQQQQHQLQQQHKNNNGQYSIKSKTTNATAALATNIIDINTSVTAAIEANSMGKHCPTSLNSSISNSVTTNASSNLSQHHHQQHHQQQQQQLQQKYMNSKRKHAHPGAVGAGGKYSNMAGVAVGVPGSHMDQNNYLHLNSLWSIWYGVLLTLFQGYLAVHGAYRFLGCSLIPWKIEPVAELNLQIVLSGVVFILLPLFFTSAVFKVGNLANDGIKLASGSRTRRCTMSPHDGLEEEACGGTLRALWTHGGPTAAFVHIVIAMCLLLPRLLLEARIIENGLLPREHIWQTELDFIAVNRRNLVVLSVVTAPYQNITSIDDADEDYYNDTMFTAVGASGAAGVGNRATISISNNLLPTSDKGSAEVAAEAGGKTRYFEVPDLINRQSAEDDNNDAELEREPDPVPTVGGVGSTDVDPVNNWPSATVAVLREGDSNELDNVKQQQHWKTSTTAWPGASSSTTTTTTSPSSTTTTTMIRTTTASPAMTTTTIATRSYDKSWDALGTLDKGATKTGASGLGGDETPATTIMTRKTTTPTAQMKALNAGKMSNKMTTAMRPATATASSNDRSSPREATTTTTSAVGVTSTITSASTTGITGHHHHHQHHQQHNNNNHHHHHHSTGKAARKHAHRRQNHRRHHGTTTTTSTTTTILPPTSRLDYVPIDEDIDKGELDWVVTDFRESAENGEERRATTRDSNIHIVRPEMLPEIIPSTPVSSNSKIIAIKTKSKSKMRRSLAADVMASNLQQVSIDPEYSFGDALVVEGSADFVPSESDGTPTTTAFSSSSNEVSESMESLEAAALLSDADTDSSFSSSSSSAATSYASANGNTGDIVRLDGFAGMLQLFFGIEKPIDVAVFAHPPSAEFVNLLFALIVWCVRYPAVFWTTTKTFGTIFSIQMIAAALDIVFSYVGISNLYKLQVYSEATPSAHNPGLILNGVVTLSLFLLSTVLIIASSMIMYLYGHGRLAAKMRDRSLITLKSSESWIYFAHCASLCFVLALAVVKAPLLNDLSATYKDNLHSPTFLSALISVVHLLLWIVIWLGLTAKRRWTFKLPPMDMYGITKATTQPLLMHHHNNHHHHNRHNSLSPALSGGIGGGGGGSIIEEKLGIDDADCGIAGGVNGVGVNGAAGNGGAEDIYWPKLAPSSPKLKVTFNEVTSTSDDVLLIGDHEQTDGKRNTSRGAAVCFTSATGEIDDGEYATLRTATAATVVGISVGVSVGSDCDGVGGNNGIGGVGLGSTGGSVVGIVSGSGSGIGNDNTPLVVGCSSGGSILNMIHLSEYDELPPPPPPQLMPSHCTPGAHINVNVSTSGTSGDYANCVGVVVAGAGVGVGVGAIGVGGYGGVGNSGEDNTSEEGKLLACVRDDSVTYASTRDLEPPHQQPPHAAHPSPTRVDGGSVCGRGRAPQAMPEIMQLSSSPEHLVSPLAPVTVTVHTNEAHIASSSTPRCLRRADSGVPNEALTPRSDTTSTTESTTSPPERAPSESSSGVHSGEERDVEVVIRPRVACKPPPKPPQPPIQEEPYGRCTNMRMSSFVADPTPRSSLPAGGSSSATLPLQRSAPDHPKFDYAHCSTMPLPVGGHGQQPHSGSGVDGYSATSAYSMHPQQQQQLQQQLQQHLQQHVTTFKTQVYANSAVAMANSNVAKLQQQQQQQQQLQQLQQSLHTTLPNGVRYSNPHFLRRMPHITKAAESPYGHLGLGAGHHTFSKLLHDPLHGGGQHSLANTAIPEDRDSANYSMSSDQDCGLYATANQLN